MTITTMKLKIQFDAKRIHHYNRTIFETGGRTRAECVGRRTDSQSHNFSRLSTSILDSVNSKLAGGRRRRTYNHVMPSQPTAKKELKTNSKTELATCAPPPLTLPSTARSTIVRVWPTAPKSINFRRPTRSIRKMAMREARKYSVPFAAAIIRDVTSERPRRWNNNV